MEADTAAVEADAPPNRPSPDRIERLELWFGHLRDLPLIELNPAVRFLAARP